MNEQPNPAWQRQRAALNHDWLKNRFLTTLDSATNVLRGRVRGEAYLSYLLADVLMDWDSRRQEIAELVRGFEDGMSPRLLLEAEPLVRADQETRRVCGAVVHQLWLTRYSVREMVKSALCALDQADSTCDSLRAILAEEKNSRSALGAIFAKFSQDCRELAKSIEAFPHAIHSV
jgi:hypothetical protein